MIFKNIGKFYYARCRSWELRPFITDGVQMVATATGLIGPENVAGILHANINIPGQVGQVEPLRSVIVTAPRVMRFGSFDKMREGRVLA